ncbi:MAG: globin family protein [Gammaproteobacteria bacterium]|jgi:hemoglobin-like flavoprotein
MTPEQINQVKASWDAVLPIQDKAAALFYEKLFELDPALRPLFKGDMEEQGRKLMSMITTAVNALNRLDDVVPAVQALGRRHADYGVKDQDYDTVASALLWTLDVGLGDAFTDEVEASWVAVYGLLAGTMKQAAAEPVAS